MVGGKYSLDFLLTEQQYSQLLSNEETLCYSWSQHVAKEALVGPVPHLLPVVFSMASFDDKRSTSSGQKSWSTTGTKTNIPKRKSLIIATKDITPAVNNQGNAPSPRDNAIRGGRARAGMVTEDRSASLGSARAVVSNPGENADDNLLAEEEDKASDTLGSYAITYVTSWTQETEIVKVRVSSVFKDLTSLRLQNPSRKWYLKY